MSNDNTNYNYESEYFSANSQEHQQLELEKLINMNPYIILQKIQDKEGGITKELIVKAIMKDGYIYSYLPINYKIDEEIIFHAVNQNGLVLEYVDKNLQEISHIYFAVKQNGLAIQYANPELFNEDIFNIAINQNGLALKFIPEYNHTEQLIINSINNNYEAIQFVGHITKRIAYHSIQKNINSIQYIPEHYHSEYNLYDLLDGIDTFINKNPSEINDFPNPTIEMYKSVIDKKIIIKNLPDNFQTEELSIYAVSNHCVNLNFVKDKFKEACKTYLKNNENCKTHNSLENKSYCAKNSEN
jgi:hypothetical protein